MKVYNFSQEEVNKMQQLCSKGTVSIEGQLFLLPKENNYLQLVFKKFLNTNDAKFLNKMKTIMDLMGQQKQCSIPFLVYPKALASLDNELCGYVMPYINGSSLKSFLNNPNISFEKKRKSLINVGNLLNMMQKVRDYSIAPNFYLNDIHEDNFLVQKDTLETYAIDLDSVSLNGNVTSQSMYLRPASRLTEYENKYKLESSNDLYDRQIIPNKHTEIYCYSIMILNFLYGDYIAFMAPDDFKRYLDYLATLDYNPNLLDAFSKLYSNESNINPVSYLDDLHEDARTNAKFYRRVLRRN